ncbi:MAG: ABC transporter permease [Defluviitaleaceae bacterium]|nr:ABC transporter permease [Defluviitaleaceae bacterium]
MRKTKFSEANNSLSIGLKSKKIAIPYLIWILIFTILPIFLLMQYAFTNNQGNFTFANIERFFNPLYLGIMWHSIRMATMATVICFFLGYPIAYILSQKAYKDKTILLFLFVVPMWMNFLVRTYAWLFILGFNGVLNNILRFFGFEPIRLLFTDGAVLLGLVYTFLPFMIFPIYSSLQKIDERIIEAARDLGSNRLQLFFRIIFPLSLPGIASALTMVFMPAVATFLISNILGGGQYFLIGNLIEQQFLTVGNRHFGSALALIMFALIILCNVIFSYLSKEEKE